MSADVTSVTGGAAGLAATYAAVRALADAYDTAGSRLRGWAALGAETMTDADLAESALLAPLTFADAECAVLAATTGPDGVLVESCGWEVDAVAVRAAVVAFETTDALARAAVDQLDRAVGHAVGFTLGATAPAVVPVVAATLPQVPPEAWRELEDWVVDHPGVVQHAANGGGGLLEGLWDGVTPLVPGGPLGLPLDVPDAESGADLLALLYGPGGHAGVSELDHVSSGPASQPADLAGLVSHLQGVAGLSPDPDSPLNGTIEIQTLGSGPGGDAHGVRHIVYLPGTDDMATLPWTQDDDIRDLPTDLVSAAGHQTGYQQGILQAMVQAGVDPDDPVLLVGHSLGGMEAAAILSQDGVGFNVTHVVTAGSPTAQVDGFPNGSHVLSLEHHGDAVPHLDGAANPDSIEQVTLTFDDDPTGLLDAHGYPHYVAGAAAADASTDPSVQEQLGSLRDHGFLGEGSGAVETHVFQIVRLP